MIGFLLDAMRFVLGAAVLLFLLYAPGAVVLNSLAARRPAPQLFSGVEEWLFSAVLISVLVTGGIGFIMAEVGWFSWWTVLLVTLVVSLALGSLAAQDIGAGSASRAGRVRLRALFNLLKVPGSYPQRSSDR